MQESLDSARTHDRWTICDLMPVLLTDGSKFCLNFTDRCQLVWRMPKERFDELNVAEHDSYGKVSVMVLAGISVKGKTDLYLIENGTLTASGYCNEILNLFVRLYADAIGPEFILIGNDALVNRSQATTNYLEC